MPMVGGKHFLFFEPIFNVADACLTTSILALVIFYNKYLVSDKKPAQEEAQEPEADSNATTQE